ncbi:sulfur carrier protein ThiS [Asaia krungthepensis]|uniref:sulfur carrier protein ThiS n=1 Tax=Asaia krungthepensis TaxID=220990 RepID=UPI002231AA0D|nr:sulfur carrier protein ThiS [Asaia krungthepensis]
MQIIVNDETKRISGRFLSDILIELGYGESKVATAIDGVFVPRSARSGRELQEGARLEILAPMQGG